MVRIFLLSLSVLFTSTFAAVSTETGAKAPVIGTPYIAQKPNDGIFKIAIIGDSLANGLFQGITQINKDNDQFKTKRLSKVNTGLVRSDRYDWNKNARKIARQRDYQIVIVQLGLNDLQSIREKGRAHHFKTPGWEERYILRTEAVMRDLKASGMAVYWTSIPIVSPKKYQEEYRYLNSIFRESAERVGVRFVDTWSPLAGSSGAYSPFWKDEDGRVLEIRKKDGVHFTPQGYQIFAGIVNDVILNDLEQAAEDQASN